MWRIFIKILVIGFVVAQAAAFGGADYSTPICSNLYESLGQGVNLGDDSRALAAIQAQLNKQTAAHHPGLDYVLSDPDAFIARTEQKFEQQKLLTPNDPYSFDYSEVGTPLLEQMHKDLIEKIAELNSLKTQVLLGSASAAVKKKYPVAELNTNLEFLNDLLADTTARIKVGKISYKDTIEMASFFSNAVGHFDTKGFSSLQRNLLKVDRTIEGHYPHSAAEEYRRYKAKEFHLFEPGAFVSAGDYAVAGPVFENAFNDKSHLSAIIVPTAEPLDSDVLMRLLSREKISFAGVTKTPIQADGFLRPSGDFFIHDLRHESIKYFVKTKYLQAHNITRAQELLLNKKLDQWLVEMQTMIGKIADPDVREAALLIVFNFNHDQGFVTAPSVYLANSKGLVHYLLHTVLTISGVGANVKKPLTSYPAAVKLIGKFWEDRAPDEAAFLESLKKL